MTTMTARKTWRIGIVSDLEVVRHDPEMADMDHPRGEVIGEVFYLLAEDDRGNRLRWGAFLSAARTEEALRLFAPAVPFWNETYPAYGSPAYAAYGEADLIAAERRMADDEAWGFDTRYTRYF